MSQTTLAEVRARAEAVRNCLAANLLTSEVAEYANYQARMIREMDIGHGMRFTEIYAVIVSMNRARESAAQAIELCEQVRATSDPNTACQLLSKVEPLLNNIEAYVLEALHLPFPD